MVMKNLQTTRRLHDKIVSWWRMEMSVDFVEIEKIIVELIGGKTQKCPWTEAKRRVFRTKDEENSAKIHWGKIITRSGIDKIYDLRGEIRDFGLRSEKIAITASFLAMIKL